MTQTSDAGRNDAADYLRYLTYRGVRERYGVDIESSVSDDTLRQRIEHELSTIEKAGFPGYFLIVADILRFCREANIPTGPGRGSICGSAVAYAVRITDVEPLRFEIPFERFLHLERIAQPDIDLDICQARRQEVIDYLRRTYGEDNVAQIITFTPMLARSVIKDVSRVLHVDDHLTGIKANQTGERLAGMIPEGQGADQVKLTEFLESPEGAEFAEQFNAITIPFEGERISFAETCLALEGLRRHGSVHAAGVVIADRPIVELAPLYKKNQDADIQIQYDMRDAEAVGLLKMDVLGLRTVTVLGEAERLVQRREPGFSIKDAPLDDHKTFALLSGGDTGAVFQLEGDGITSACTGMRPDRFEDIIALIALYRPGPMDQLGSYFRRKHGEEPVEYAHPSLEPILQRTYGLMVYQEQVMGIVRTLGGYTAGEADQFRKAIGKKLVPMIKEKIDEFVNRAVALGHDPALIKSIGDQIFFFGRYGFNLGHATGYGFITYWTAYLKANWPAEFFTANLNSQIGDLDRVGKLLRDADKHGIKIAPPDINRSGRGFTLDEDQTTIRLGLGAIKGLGDNYTQDILEERDSDTKTSNARVKVTRTKDDGTPYNAHIRSNERISNTPRPFDDIYDFCRRLPSIPVDKKRALVVGGAFGIDPDYRGRLWSALDRVNDAAKRGRTIDLDSETSYAGPTEVLQAEKNCLGFYISGHPLAAYREALDRYRAVTDGTLEGLDTKCVVAGTVLEIKPHMSSRGEMGWITLETNIEKLPRITVFNEVWSKCKGRLDKDKVVIVKGMKKWEVKYGWGIIANEVIVLDRARPSADVISISMPNTDVMDLQILQKIASDDGANVQIVVESGSEGRLALIATGILLEPTNANLATLEEMGWLVNIDPLDPSELSWPDLHFCLRPTDGFGGSGPNRTHANDLTIVKAATRILDGRLVTELKKT